MSKMMLRLLLLSGLAMGSLAVIGCADDSSDEDADTSEGEDTNRPGADAGEDDEDGNTSLDTGVVPGEDGGSEPGEDTSEEPSVCDSLGVADNLGQSCDLNDAAACGASGACLQFEGTPGAQCYTLCLPELCGQTCGAAEQCIPLVAVDPATNERVPQTFDSDGDGEGDTPLGGCIVPPTGEVTAYGICDADNLCGAGLDCIGFSPDSDSICSGDCTTSADCPVIDGIGGTCVPVTIDGGGQTSKCLLPCTSGSDEGCPPAFSCVPVQGDNGLCIPN